MLNPLAARPHRLLTRCWTECWWTHCGKNFDLILPYLYVSGVLTLCPYLFGCTYDLPTLVLGSARTTDLIKALTSTTALTIKPAQAPEVPIKYHVQEHGKTAMTFIVEDGGEPEYLFAAAVCTASYRLRSNMVYFVYRRHNFQPAESTDYTRRL